MHAMESLIELFNEWEIQLLVLLSFTLQLILFLTGSLRRRSTSGFLRLFIWAAYLGADLVAVYALGLLSRDENITTCTPRSTRTTQPLAFFWAPFLLIHLGGQDTITALSMEDNNLWLRHLLKLVVQVVLTFYVFWRVISTRHRVGLLVSCIFVFVAGIIKYGERTWCLKRGCLAGLDDLTRNMTVQNEEIGADDGRYSRTVRVALRTMPYVLSLFSARELASYWRQDSNKMVKMGRLQLGLMYDELYTKALVLRTRSVMMFRHVSQISVVVAFALFHANDKRRYAKADVAITYSLFIGGFFLEVCAMLNSMMSPWTWSMLKDRNWGRLARLSWFILSSDIGWPEKKQRWPSSIGQYNFLSWLMTSSDRPRMTFSQRVMTVVTRVSVDLVGAKKAKIFWMSKLLDTWYVDADEMTMACVAKEIILLHDELGGRPTREWPNLGSLLKGLQDKLDHNFGLAVVHMHMMTELHLSKYPPPSDMAAAAAADDDDDVAFGMVQVCRKLSNYMMYLLVAHPSMLPLTFNSVVMLESLQTSYLNSDRVRKITEEIDKYDLQPNKETVEEMVQLWTRILLYSAGKSPTEMHAAQLSRGGELITLAWLLMAFYRLGDSQNRRIDIINIYTPDQEYIAKKEVYAFNIIARTS